MKSLFGAFGLLALLSPLSLAQTLAVRGETVYTLSGKPLPDGMVLVENGKITKVGRAADIVLPAGIKIVTAKVVTPGLIDARSVVGLAGYLNQPHDQQQLDPGGPMQPELRAIDAYNPREALIEWVRTFGVTTLHTGHAPGALLAGQTLIAHTVGDSVDEAVTVPEAMVVASLTDDAASGSTRAKRIAQLRAELIRAKESLAKKGGESTRDLRREALVRVLKREVPLLVAANRAIDIAAALRLQKEFGFTLILDGGAEALSLADALKGAEVAVLLHATMARPDGDAHDLSLETAGALKKAGVRFAIQSGYEGYVPKTRVVLFEAAMAAANGLAFEDALAAITRDAAQILGISKRVGTLESGKDGDLALYDGDPFEFTTHCTGTIIGGKLLFEGVR